MLHRSGLSYLMMSALLVACGPRSGDSQAGYPTRRAFMPLLGTELVGNADASAMAVTTRTPAPTPTRAPLSVAIPTHDPASPLATPTPDRPHTEPTLRQQTHEYVVRAGDTLGSIAQSFGVSVEILGQANGLTDQNLISVGQTLEVPAPKPAASGSSFKIIPDSELVDGPTSAQLDIDALVKREAGYLSGYTEAVNDTTLTGSQVVARVAQDYSVNPRLLLALLDYRTHWVTSREPADGTLDYPMGFVEPSRSGLYHQLAWAANELNRGFYLWRASAIGAWVLHDGSVVPIDPTINAGTAAVQAMFSVLDNRTTWDTDVNAFGLFESYFFLFGNPFDLSVDPLRPGNLAQPPMDLPFESGAIWAFTGGPHAAWDSGSAWGALDFAPADTSACAISQQWVTAVANGFIVRTADGAVVQDLDGDGYEQTGWDVLYLHVATPERVAPGAYVFAGDRIGHASCEGGVANAAHLHLARKYNGEWISSDGLLPFALDGWISAGNGTEYDGYLQRGSITLEAAEGISELNQITR